MERLQRSCAALAGNPAENGTPSIQAVLCHDRRNSCCSASLVERLRTRVRRALLHSTLGDGQDCAPFISALAMRAFSTEYCSAVDAEEAQCSPSPSGAENPLCCKSNVSGTAPTASPVPVRRSVRRVTRCPDEGMKVAQRIGYVLWHRLRRAARHPAVLRVHRRTRVVGSSTHLGTSTGRWRIAAVRA